MELQMNFKWAEVLDHLRGAMDLTLIQNAVRRGQPVILKSPINYVYNFLTKLTAAKFYEARVPRRWQDKTSTLDY